ncbi:hypothetical protein E4U31_002659 [Claviceps sp. LM219 group G6]|nr:hypothetical protein E4U31_002659 [Claviceps sp. LM219 group G6]
MAPTTVPATAKKRKRNRITVEHRQALSSQDPGVVILPIELKARNIPIVTAADDDFAFAVQVPVLLSSMRGKRKAVTMGMLRALSSVSRMTTPRSCQRTDTTLSTKALKNEDIWNYTRTNFAIRR